MDEFYTYDGMHQLTNFDRGDLNATQTAISGTPARAEEFTFGTYQVSGTDSGDYATGTYVVRQNVPIDAPQKVPDTNGTVECQTTTHRAALWVNYQ